jgi:tetratricopeptide (TPR) repeat protein/predicted Ser/Thr protein kinase
VTVSVDTPTTGTEPTQPAARASLLQLGQRFGDRYLVRGFLGEGGMGAVYRAHDEKLGVDVALKVVRGEARVDELRDEVRLAQKVTHPNVCRTYDLEEVDGRSLIKMEFVEGETLAKRVSELGKLPVVDVVRIARAILAGLRAAHEQGIVHRDLKLSNVMLAGDRVVLMDFGVARRVADEGGSTAGTLGYMAPEQIANLAIDGRADLYALGCVMYAMLAGEPVFAAPNALQLGVAHVSVPAPDVRAKRRDTPRWLARALGKLLAKEPAPRVLGARALDAGPLSLRRFALPAAAVALAAGGALVLVRGSHGAPEPCTGIQQRLAGVWDAQTRTTVHDAFVKTKVPYAEKSFTALARGLDAYAAAWTSAVTDSCRATRVRGEQSEEALALREACFDDELAELAAVVKQLGDVSAPLVNKADKVATDLDPASACANVVALRLEGTPLPAVEPAIIALHAKLNDAKAQMITGKLLPVLVETKEIIDDATAAHWEPLAADAYHLRAAVLIAVGNVSDGVAAMKQALWTGLRARDDFVAADSAFMLATLSAEQFGKLDEAQLWIELGVATAARSGQENRLEAARAHSTAVVAAMRGDLNTAVAEYEKFYANAKARIGGGLAEIATVEDGFGATLAKAGACGLAIPHYQRALDATAELFGLDNQTAITMLSNLGLCYRHIGDLANARAELSKSVATGEKLFGKTSPLLVAPLDNYAELLSEQGDHEEALALFERARSLAAVSRGTDHPSYHQVVTDYGAALAAAGKLAESQRVFDDVLVLEKKSASSITPKTLSERAKLALAEHRPAEAEAFATESIAGFEAQGGKDQPELWLPLVYLADAKIARNDAAAARPLVERALASATKAHIPDHDLAPLREVQGKLH